MTDKPRKKLSLVRKPKPATDVVEEGASTEPERTVKRAGKRRIIKNDIAKPTRPAKPVAKFDKSKKRPPRKNKKKALVSPSDLKAQALDERLKAFDVWSTYKPLATGIDKTIYQLVNDEAFAGASKKVVQKLLRMHTNHARYLQALSRGGMRYQLDGTESENVNEYQRQLAIETQAKRVGRLTK